ncbi:uroporphyrinogen-III synthase [Rhizobium sp. P32RR-XVIII]|uniref:uroporphyrinogen-III synthase n=1 Tax=Rhizobium sp. P32RR-XVIII TaxID=2726738 RepID=UPI00145734C7|nr:uroporphyrinogen-III synthase [Rhizobium sp. P32RR-XVIII]NLS05657.1 uroporphyrinogen-III synthase [Rhizobium sp. P32RR-XVIII]
MRVLVTRPLPSGERTANSLRDMGHEPVLLPLSRPVHDSRAAIDGLTKSNGPIAITSAEAVRVLSLSGEDIKPHLLRPLFAVGGASATEAQAIGFNSVAASSGDGAQLAELIARQTRGTVTYLAGRPRAETFELRSRALDLKLDVIECYRMQPATPDPDTLRTALTPPPQAILLYSRQTAESFFHLAEIQSESAWIDDALILCLSKSVATAIPAALGKKLRIAASPDETSLLSLL